MRPLTQKEIGSIAGGPGDNQACTDCEIPIEGSEFFPENDSSQAMEDYLNQQDG